MSFTESPEINIVLALMPMALLMIVSKKEDLEMLKIELVLILVPLALVMMCLIGTTVFLGALFPLLHLLV